MDHTYFEEEPTLRAPRLFGGQWKQLFVDHLRDCYRQRRVFREALDDMRNEVLNETTRMHNDNQKKMVELSDRLSQGQDEIEKFQKWIFVTVITILAGLLGYFITHYGPLAGHG